MARGDGNNHETDRVQAEILFGKIIALINESAMLPAPYGAQTLKKVLTHVELIGRQQSLPEPPEVMDKPSDSHEDETPRKPTPYSGDSTPHCRAFLILTLLDQNKDGGPMPIGRIENALEDASLGMKDRQSLNSKLSKWKKDNKFVDWTVLNRRVITEEGSKYLKDVSDGLSPETRKELKKIAFRN